MFDIISIGSATRDVFLSVEGQSVKSPQFPMGDGLCFPMGSKIEIKKIVTTCGGGGTNAAVTFARQGFKTAFIGVVGEDSNGREIINELKNEGIETQYVAWHKDDQTAYSTILVHPSGERTILSYKGEGQHFEAMQLNLDKLQSAWLFLNSLGGHYDVLEKAVQWAVANKVKLAANPGSKELALGLDKLKPLWKNFAIVSMNQEEAAALTGISHQEEDKILKSMVEIIDGIFVMTKGPAGVVVSDGDHVYRAGVPDSPVIERTGAGDAFVSGFIVQYARSRDIIKSIQFATANSSSVVTQFGAKAGILKANDWGPWPLVKVELE